VLGTYVRIYHEYTCAPAGGRLVRDYKDLLVFREGSVRSDSQLGAILYCKHECYLLKRETVLEIVTLRVSDK